MTTITKRFPYSLALALIVTLACIQLPISQEAAAQISVTRTITDPVGNTETWIYQDNLGVHKLLSRTSIVDGKGVINQYDANNNLVSREDPEGRATTYTYNGYNQKTAMTEAAGTADARTTTYEYYSSDIDRVTRMVEPGVAGFGYDKETLTTYDANLNPISVTINGYQPNGTAISRTTNYTYNAIGQVVSIDGPRTDVTDITTFTYNTCSSGGGCGQLASVTDAAGHFATYNSYDAGGLLLQSTGVNGTILSYTYDQRQRVTQVTVTSLTGSARTTSYSYDNVGQLLRITLPDGLVITNTYNAARYLMSVTDNQGNRIKYSYDLKGNRIKTEVKDSQGMLERVVDTAYDHRNFVVQINTGGSITDMVKDAIGNLTLQTDPNLNPSTSHTYDALDRLNQYIDAIGGQTLYQYNAQDQLIQVQSPNGATTDYMYDDLGNLLSEVSPDRGALSYSHDIAGNVTSATDARNITVNYGYDELNRLVSVDYPGTEEDISYVYDSCLSGDGKICQVTDASGVTDYAYDGFGNIASESRTELGNTYVTQYGYDAADRVTQIIYPDQSIVSYVRDSVGRIESVNRTTSSGTVSLTAGRAYRADGLLASQTFGNGLSNTRQYDQQGRMQSQDVGSVLQHAYTYDDNGNITAKDSDLFSYDALDRLTEDRHASSAINYTYDGNGNRLTEDINGTLSNYTYDTYSNRLQSIDSNNTTRDAAGNTLSDQGGNRTFTYLNSGQLASVSMAGALVAEYHYNARRQRTQKVAHLPGGGTQTTVFLYDLSGSLIAESHSNGTLQRQYIHADGIPLAIATDHNQAPSTIVETQIDHNWITVPFVAHSQTPVIIASPPTYFGGQPGVVRLRNIQTGQLDVRFQEWKYLDQTHVVENMVLLALPPGRYPQADGSIWEIGTFNATGVFGTGSTTATWIPVSFSAAFPAKPYLFLTMQTYNGGDTVTVRARNVTATRFEAGQQEEEAINTGHITEVIGYVAVYNPSGSGTAQIGAQVFDYSLEQVSVNHNFTAISGGHQLKVEEERSANTEVRHVTEQLDVLHINNHIFAQDVRVAGGDPMALRRISTAGAAANGDIFYFHTDHLNTPRALSDANGDVVWRWEGAAFGSTAPDSDPDGNGNLVTNNLRFPGQYFDVESGLYYNWNRYYNPKLGRYITSDLIGLRGGINTYGYVDQNPLRYVDSNGLVKWNGTQTVVAAGLGGGAVRFKFVLESECVAGKKAKAEVIAGGFALLAGSPVSFTHSRSVDFEDNRSAPDPFVFSGPSKYAYASWAMSWSGVSAQWLKLGDAEARGVGGQYGWDTSVAVGAGISHVDKGEIVNCGCNK